MDIICLTDKRENLIRPLFDWKILGAMELKNLSGYQGNYRNLMKMIKKLEKEGVVNSFTHAMNNRKFFYVSKKAFSHFTDEKSFINEEIKMHDAIVSTLAFKFNLLDMTKSIKINSDRNVSTSGVFSSGDVEPDATIEYQYHGKVAKLALEVELNRKNSTSITKKFMGYHNDDKTSLALYFFTNKYHLEAYFNYYNEFRQRNNISIQDVKIVFLYSSKIADFDFDLLSIFWKRPEGEMSNLKGLLHG